MSDLNAFKVEHYKDTKSVRWASSRTALAVFINKGMTQAQAVHYLKLHRVPQRWEPKLPAYCDGDIDKLLECDKVIKRSRVFDMEAVKSLSKVHDINQARTDVLEDL